MSLICYNQFKIVIYLTLIKLVLSDHSDSVTWNLSASRIAIEWPSGLPTKKQN